MEVETCRAGQPIYAFATQNGEVQLRPCSRKATWIRSDAVLASHKAAANRTIPPTAKPTAAAASPSVSKQQVPAEAAPAKQDEVQKAKKKKKHKEGKHKDRDTEKTGKVCNACENCVTCSEGICICCSHLSVV